MGLVKKKPNGLLISKAIYTGVLFLSLFLNVLTGTFSTANLVITDIRYDASVFEINVPYNNDSKIIIDSAVRYKVNTYILLISTEASNETSLIVTSDFFYYRTDLRTINYITSLPEGFSFLFIENDMIYCSNYTHMARFSLIDSQDVWEFKPYYVLRNNESLNIRIQARVFLNDGNQWVAFSNGTMFVFALLDPTRSGRVTPIFQFNRTSRFMAIDAGKAFIKDDQLIAPVVGYEHDSKGYWASYYQVFLNGSFWYHRVYLTDKEVDWVSIYPVNVSSVIALWSVNEPVRADPTNSSSPLIGNVYRTSIGITKKDILRHKQTLAREEWSGTQWIHFEHLYQTFYSFEDNTFYVLMRNHSIIEDNPIGDFSFSLITVSSNDFVLRHVQVLVLHEEYPRDIFFHKIGSPPKGFLITLSSYYNDNGVWKQRLYLVVLDKKVEIASSHVDSLLFDSVLFASFVGVFGITGLMIHVKRKKH